jgi:hypothetical protein
MNERYVIFRSSRYRHHRGWRQCGTFVKGDGNSITLNIKAEEDPLEGWQRIDKEEQITLPRRYAVLEQISVEEKELFLMLL